MKCQELRIGDRNLGAGVDVFDKSGELCLGDGLVLVQFLDDFTGKCLDKELLKGAVQNVKSHRPTIV